MRWQWSGASVVVAGMLLAACHLVDTNPNQVTSIGIDPLASPSVVVGDTLRDTLGVAQPLHAIAYNIDDDPLSSFPIRYRAADTGVVVDSITGYVLGTSVLPQNLRVLGDAGGLQTQPLLVYVVPSPDTVIADPNNADSIAYSLIDSTMNISGALGVQVLHKSSSSLDPVQAYIVSFAILSPTDTSLAQLVGDDGQTQSLVDTTGTDGTANRRIHLRPIHLTSTTDSVIVLGTVKYKGVQIPGSPVRIVLQVKPSS